MERRDTAFEFEASDAVARVIYIGEDKANEGANVGQGGGSTDEEAGGEVGADRPANKEEDVEPGTPRAEKSKDVPYLRTDMKIIGGYKSKEERGEEEDLGFCA